MEIKEDDATFQPLEIKDLDPSSNSVVHCVHMKLKSDPEEKKLREFLRRARSRIPGLIELQFGKNDMHIYKGKSEDPSGNTHCLVSRHENAQALSVYQKHPEHVVLAKFLLSLAERPPTVIDFVNIPSKL